MARQLTTAALAAIPLLQLAAGGSGRSGPNGEFGAAGVYDSLVLARFWEPQAHSCASWGGSNLTLHGLWPQYSTHHTAGAPTGLPGDWPQFCGKSGAAAVSAHSEGRLRAECLPRRRKQLLVEGAADPAERGGAVQGSMVTGRPGLRGRHSRSTRVSTNGLPQSEVIRVTFMGHSPFKRAPLRRESRCARVCFVMRARPAIVLACQARKLAALLPRPRMNACLEFIRARTAARGADGRSTEHATAQVRPSSRVAWRRPQRVRSALNLPVRRHHGRPEPAGAYRHPAPLLPGLAHVSMTLSFSPCRAVAWAGQRGSRWEADSRLHLDGTRSRRLMDMYPTPAALHIAQASKQGMTLAALQQVSFRSRTHCKVVSDHCPRAGRSLVFFLLSSFKGRTQQCSGFPNSGDVRI